MKDSKKTWKKFYQISRIKIVKLIEYLYNVLQNRVVRVFPVNYLMDLYREITQSIILDFIYLIKTFLLFNSNDSILNINTSIKTRERKTFCKGWKVMLIKFYLSYILEESLIKTIIL